MRKRYKAIWAVSIIAAAVYIMNASWLAGPAQNEMTLLSHRGMAQNFSPEGLTNETCTAARIYAPRHAFLENTIDGFKAAVAAGASMIELDVHPTSDGEFAVFHDWTLDCRTNGKGRTRDFDLAYLKTLDIGYGYTADEGQTFPFRGKHPGAMPSLREVIEEIPVPIVINIKSRDPKEGEALAAYVPASAWTRLSVAGHPVPVAAVKSQHSGVKTMTKQDAKACLKSYVLLGWSGHVPQACRQAYVPVPANYRRLMWGWPQRFEARLNRYNSRSILMGPYKGQGSTGIDTADDLNFVPKNYSGIIWTNTTGVIGPALGMKP